MRTKSKSAGALGLAVFLVALPGFDANAQQVARASYVLNKSFQLPAKGQPGSPEEPHGLAVGPEGAVHVADERGSVFVFDSVGIYRRSYGQAALRKPRALVVREEIYVLDEDLKQIVVFGPGGQALRTIGESGNRGGQLDRPMDLALGPSGYVYVLDSGRKGVQIFSRDGVFIRHIYFGDAIREPQALAVARDGSIYISDERAPSLVHAYPPFPELPWMGPMPAAEQVSFSGGSFEEPVALAVNEYGQVVLLDRKQGRVWSHRRGEPGGPGSGSDVIYGGLGSGRGSFEEAADIAMEGASEILILDSKLRKVERIRLTGGGAGEPLPRFDYRVRVTRGAAPLPERLHAVGYKPGQDPLFLLEVEGRALSVLGSRAQLRPTVYGDTVSSYTLSAEAFQQHFSRDLESVGSATLNDTVVLVSDTRNDRFALFELDTGAPKATIGDTYRDDRRLDDPQGIVMNGLGQILVCDSGNDLVKIFSNDLASLVASVPFQDPHGLALSPSGQLFVWDEDGNRVGRLPPGATAFEPLPEGLHLGVVASMTFDQAGNLFVLDRETHRVTVFDSELKRVLIQLGSEEALDRPERVVVDRDGGIYVVDGGAKRTLIYRWQVRLPALAGLSVEYAPDALDLSWSPGPDHFVQAYELQAGSKPDGPYSVHDRTDGARYRLRGDDLEEPFPRFVRVVPISITGARGHPTDPIPTLHLTARVLHRRGDHAEALRDAARALELTDEGTLGAGSGLRANLLQVALFSASALERYEEAAEFGERLVEMEGSDVSVETLTRLVRAQIELGDPTTAAQRLMSVVARKPGTDHFTDPTLMELSFDVYRSMSESRSSERALEFLRSYVSAIPAPLDALGDQYADSLLVFETRGRLGPGFESWRTANYAEVVRFFSEQLESGDLTDEQEILSREILAAAYFAFGRQDEAERIFQEIYRTQPDFDVQAESERVARLYGLNIYNPETEQFFGELGS